MTILYIDGKESARGNKKGKLRAGGSFILGQEQDAVEGRFDKNQRFIGDLCHLQMWDRVLSATELEALFKGQAVPPGNVFDYPPTYTYELRGGAIIRNEMGKHPLMTHRTHFCKLSNEMLKKPLPP